MDGPIWRYVLPLMQDNDQTINAIVCSDFPESWCQYAFIIEIIAIKKNCITGLVNN